MRCDRCDRDGFATHQQLERHKQRVHSGKTWPCPHCGKEFSRKDSMKAHVKRKHPNSKDSQDVRDTNMDPAPSLACPQCGKSNFEKKSQLDFHLNRVHNAPTWVCQLCQKKFMRKNNLEQHVKLKHRGSGDDAPPNKEDQPPRISYCESNSLAKHVPYPEAEKYTITHFVRDQTYKTTSTRFTDLILKFRGLSEHGFSDAMEILEKSLHNVMSALCRRVKARDHDLVRWIFNSPQLRSPISISLVRVDQSSVALLMEALDRVLQSYENFNIDDKILVNFVYQAMPSPVVAGLAENPMSRRSIVGVENFIRSKRSIVTPKNVGFLDNMCFPLVLFLEKYISDRQLREKAISKGRRFVLNDYIDSMKYRHHVKEMIALSKIRRKTDSTPFTMDQCVSLAKWFMERFSKEDSDFAIHCYEATEEWRQVWMVGKPSAKTHIHVIVHESHAYLCVDIHKFWGRRYGFCEPCGKQHLRNLKHDCPHKACRDMCALCSNPLCDLRGVPAADLTATPSSTNQCFDCRTQFSYLQCLQAHRINRHHCIRSDYKRCLFCGRLDSKKFFQQDKSIHLENFCDTTHCRKCNERKPIGHEFCFVYPYSDTGSRETSYSNAPSIDLEREVPKARKKPLLYFFDSEAMIAGNSEGRHQFVLVVLQRQDGTEQEFYGPNAVDQFMSFLFLEKVTEKRIVLAHNFRGYDSMPVLEWAYSKGLSPDIVFSGQSCLRIYFPKVKLEFKCSFNFIKQPLSNFGKCFSLEESKGFFPHLFHTPETSSYIGKLPDKKFYLPETLSPTRHEEFLKWYEIEKEGVGENWNLKETLIAYCKKDVEILRKGCTLYAQMSEKVCGLNPFITALTAASATMQAFRKDFLEKDSIVIIHDHGLQPETKFSRMAEQWLAWVSYKENIDIKSSLNGKEARVGPYRLDGAVITSKPLPFLCPSMNFTEERERVFALEMMGCHVHGCTKCGNQEKRNPFTGEKLKYCMIKTEKKRKYLWERGIKMITKQSCEFMKEVSENEELKQFIDTLGGLALPLAPRSAFFGGRTNLTTLYHDCGPREKIRYVDFNSLYPFVCSFRDYPVGPPTVMRFGLDNIRLDQLFGLVKLTILPPQGLFLPVLPIKASGKLVFTLCRTCAEEQVHSAKCCHNENQRALYQETYTTEEIKLAVKHGYKILKIYEVWHWEKKSDTLFREFLMGWYKIKLQSSPRPKNQSVQQFVQEAYSNYGVQINPEDVEENPAMRTLAKDRLNSFWGKWGQRLNLEKTAIVKEYSDLFARLSDPNSEDPNIFGLGNDTLLVTWKQQNEHVAPVSNLSLAIAIFTASWARIHLYKEIFEVLHPEQILYFDTDSCVFIEKDGYPTLNTGSCQLGGLVDEIPDDQEVLRYFSAGPKCWALEVRNKNGSEKHWISKSKGIKMTNKSLEDLPIQEMYKAVRRLDFTPKIITDPHKIRRNIKKGQLFSKEEEKSWKINITKRVICEDGKHTLPFGYHLEN